MQLNLPIYLNEDDRLQHEAVTNMRKVHRTCHKKQHEAALNTISPLLEERQPVGAGHIEDTFALFVPSFNEE